VKTSFGGSPSKEVCLLLDPSTVFWLAMIAYISIGRVFGRLKFLRGLPFLLDRRP
jgi:hypothetical protein